MQVFFSSFFIISAENFVRGVANVYASYRNRVLFNETFDVCRDIHVKGLKCPMKKGTSITFNLSAYLVPN